MLRLIKWMFVLLFFVIGFFVGYSIFDQVKSGAIGASPPPPVLESSPIFDDSATPANSSPQPLVGPEWHTAFEGNLNSDGQRDVVAYKPAPMQPDPSLLNEETGMSDGVGVAEAIIVQEGELEDPQIQASISSKGVYAGNVALLSEEQFGEVRPSAFLMSVDPQAMPSVSFIPLNETGEAYAQGFGVYWNEGQRGYRLFANGQAVPPPDTPPGSTLPLTTPTPSPASSGEQEGEQEGKQGGEQEKEELEIALYWFVGEELQSEERRIPYTVAVGTAALERLLDGPHHPRFSTALPTPEEVQTYPGRQPDWGDRVRLLGLTVEDGIATANFSQEMRAYGGGSTRVQMIREQITQTLLQFPTVDEVRIAVEGETETVLQP